MQALGYDREFRAIDEIGPAKREMDGLEPGGKVRVKRPHRRGTLDARWTGPHVLEVQTRNEG